MKPTWRTMFGLALHGGAGALREQDYAGELAHMRGLVEAGATACGPAPGAGCRDRDRAALEASGLYVAGRGASPNTAGRFELDAAIMDGPTAASGRWPPWRASPRRSTPPAR